MSKLRDYERSLSYVFSVFKQEKTLLEVHSSEVNNAKSKWKKARQKASHYYTQVVKTIERRVMFPPSGERHVDLHIYASRLSLVDHTTSNQWDFTPYTFTEISKSLAGNCI